MPNYDKEKYVGDICIKATIVPLLEEICGLIKIAFGPLGDAVMVQQKSPKEAKITKVKDMTFDVKEYFFLNFINKR